MDVPRLFAVDDYCTVPIEEWQRKGKNKYFPIPPSLRGLLWISNATNGGGWDGGIFF